MAADANVFILSGALLLCGRPAGIGSETVLRAPVLVRDASDSGEERRGQMVCKADRSGCDSNVSVFFD